MVRKCSLRRRILPFSHDTDRLWFLPFLSNPTYVYGPDCIPFVIKKGFVVAAAHTIHISLELFTVLKILWRKMGLDLRVAERKGKIMMT